MKIFVYESIPLAQRDDEFIKIQELIDAKKKFLIEKHKKINNMSKQNHFLNEIKDDYNKYYRHISQQKIDQLKALQLLNEYIYDLTTSGQLSEHNIADAKEEQKKILKEIKIIKSSLDSIINDTDDIGALLKEKNMVNNYV